MEKHIALSYGAWVQPVSAPKRRVKRRKIKVVALFRAIYNRLKPPVIRRQPARKHK